MQFYGVKPKLLGTASFFGSDDLLDLPQVYDNKYVAIIISTMKI